MTIETTNTLAHLIATPHDVAIVACSEFACNRLNVWAKALPDGRCVAGKNVKFVLAAYAKLTK